MMKSRWWLYSCVFLLACLVAFRAVVMPVTHDEASTWLNYRHYNLWLCLSDYWCWHTANNHWLNTLLMQWSGDLFGEVAWALRLPNVIAGGSYFLVAALICFRYVASPVLRAAGFFLLCAHLYLLDFFSLFRGYGLMVSFTLWAIYCFLRYSEGYSFRWLLCTLLAMVLAVFSNFTALLPFVSFGVAWCFLLLLNKRYSLLLKHGALWVSIVLIFTFLLAYPIRLLNGSSEFEWGSEGLTAMMTDLMNNLLYGRSYLGALSSTYFVWLGVMIFVLLGIMSLVNKPVNSKNPILISLVLLIANFVLVVLHQKLTGSQAPIGRKSIYLIPFLFVPLVLGLNFITSRKLFIPVSVFVSGLLLFHTYRVYSPASCREWYYDAYYPELFSATLPAVVPGDSITLGSSWIFNPSLTFYQKSKSLPIGGLIYQKPMVIDSTMQYYYVEATDTLGMHIHGYEKVKHIGPFFLFKKAIVQ